MPDSARDDRLKWIYSSSSNKELEDRYDEWAGLYDQDVSADLGFLGPRRVAEALAANASTDAKVLDAGAGTGLVGDELAKLGFKHLTAIDISNGMLDIARAKGVYEALQREVLGETLNFEDDAFDALTCVGTLTIGHAPPESLDEFVRVVKPGGLVVIGMRPDHRGPGGFAAKSDQLESEGRWKLTSKSDPYQPFPETEPEMQYETWIYEILT